MACVAPLVNKVTISPASKTEGAVEKIPANCFGLQACEISAKMQTSNPPATNLATYSSSIGILLCLLSPHLTDKLSIDDYTLRIGSTLPLVARSGELSRYK